MNRLTTIGIAAAITSTGSWMMPTAQASATAAYQAAQLTTLQAIANEDSLTAPALQTINNTLSYIPMEGDPPAESIGNMIHTMQGYESTIMANSQANTYGDEPINANPTSLGPPAYDPWWEAGQAAPPPTANNTNYIPNTQLPLGTTIFTTAGNVPYAEITANALGSITPTDQTRWEYPIFATGTAAYTAPSQYGAPASTMYGNGTSVFQWEPARTENAISQLNGETLLTNSAWSNSTYSPQSVFMDKYGIPDDQTPYGDSVFKREAITGSSGTVSENVQSTASVFRDATGNGVFTFRAYNQNTSDGSYYGKQQYSSTALTPSQSVFDAYLNGSTSHNGQPATGNTGMGSVFVTDDTGNGNVGHSVFLDKNNNSYLDDIAAALQLPNNQTTQDTYKAIITPTFWQLTGTGGYYTNQGPLSTLEIGLTTKTSQLGLASLYALANGITETNFNNAGSQITDYTLPFNAIESAAMSGQPGETPTTWYNGVGGYSALTGENGTFKNFFAQAFYAPPSAYAQSNGGYDANGNTEQLIPYLAVFGRLGNNAAGQTPQEQIEADNDQAASAFGAQTYTDFDPIAEYAGNSTSSQGWLNPQNENSPFLQAGIPAIGIVAVFNAFEPTPLNTTVTSGGYSFYNAVAPNEQAGKTYTNNAQFTYAAQWYPAMDANSPDLSTAQLEATWQNAPILGSQSPGVQYFQSLGIQTNETLLPEGIPNLPGNQGILDAILQAMANGIDYWSNNFSYLRPLWQMMWALAVILATLRLLQWALVGGSMSLLDAQLDQQRRMNAQDEYDAKADLVARGFTHRAARRAARNG